MSAGVALQTTHIEARGVGVSLSSALGMGVSASVLVLSLRIRSATAARKATIAVSDSSRPFSSRRMARSHSHVAQCSCGTMMVRSSSRASQSRRPGRCPDLDAP